MDRFKKIFSKSVAANLWAIEPNALQTISDVIEFAEDGVNMTQAEIKAALGFGGVERAPQVGISVIQLFGAITHRDNIMTQFFGGATVQGFRRQFQKALGDPTAGKILIEIDSPGGTVEGIQEIADEIFEARGKGKQITAIANATAASAAYWIGSAADDFSVTPSGRVGSIGVFTIHFDQSKNYEEHGIKPTIISAGKFKTEGNPFEPLSVEAEANIQMNIDKIYNQFVKSVAKNRGISTAEVIKSFGQGRTILAKDAAALKMVDRVETFEKAVSRLIGRTKTSGKSFATDSMRLGLLAQ